MLANCASFLPPKSVLVIFILVVFLITRTGVHHAAELSRLMVLVFLLPLKLSQALDP